MTSQKRTASPRPLHRDGLSIVESMVSVVITGIMIAMVLHTFGSTAKGRRIQIDRQTAAAMARHLMSEVIQASYEDPNGSAVFGKDPGENGNSREKFDDVDDYHDWSALPPQHRNGTVLSNKTGWLRTVTVNYLSPTTLTSVDQDSGLKQITVTVTTPTGEAVSTTALRANNGAYDQSPATGTHVTWVGVELQVGTDRRGLISSGTHVLNTATSE